MGILNVTPDSFSDAGRYFLAANRRRAPRTPIRAPHTVNRAAIRRAKEMINEGADIIDIGGESSGPGSSHVSLEEELRRIIPVIKKCARLPEVRRGKVKISADTYKAETARQAIAAGARIINDITALRGDTGMAGVIAKYGAKTGVKIILMYSKDPTARTSHMRKKYKDVVPHIKKFLRERILHARAQGIKKSQIIIDPGMGAFVSMIPKYSFEILRRLNEFKSLGCPILIGTSKKSFLGGAMLERAAPTFITNVAAMINGADILRVHDVRLNVQ